MRTILVMALKDLQLISRDWGGMFFIVAFPVLMAVFFGMLGGLYDTSSAQISIAAVDEDQSPMSNHLLEALKETGNLTVDLHSREAAMQRVRQGKNAGVVIIPEGFGKKAGLMGVENIPLQLGMDPSRQAEAAMLQGLIMKAVGQLIVVRLNEPLDTDRFFKEVESAIQDSKGGAQKLQDLAIEAGHSLGGQLMRNAQASTSSDTAEEETQPKFEFDLVKIDQIDVVAESTGNEAIQKVQSAWDISFPQAMLWGVLGCAAGFAVTIVRERKLGTFFRLQVAPINRFQILAGKGLACFTAVITVIVLMTILGISLGMQIGNPIFLVMAALSVAFCFVGIMMLMSVIGDTEETVAGASWGANVLMSMLGGGMVPLAFMPGFLQKISHASPVKWGILSLEGAIWRDFTFSEMLLPCSVLLGCGAVCLAIGTHLLIRKTS